MFRSISRSPRSLDFPDDIGEFSWGIWTPILFARILKAGFAPPWICLFATTGLTEY